MSDCGGCADLGSHQRWCPVKVGPVASRLGLLAAEVDATGDSIGGNDPAAANACYSAARNLAAAARAAITTEDAR